MVALTLTPKTRYNRVLSRGIQQRAGAMVREIQSAQQSSAAVAQATSLALLERHRPEAPPRRGRDEPSISSVLKWRPFQSTLGVGINLSQLNGSVKHWIIQEIGTGERATVRVAGRVNPVGRPAAGATYIRTVKSQEGRRIRASLVWATGPGGNWVRPGAGSGQQLYLRNQIKGVPHTGTRSQPGIIIHKEIEPRHFVQKGGEAGFRVYRGSVLAAAQRQFRKRTSL